MLHVTDKENCARDRLDMVKKAENSKEKLELF